MREDNDVSMPPSTVPGRPSRLARVGRTARGQAGPCRWKCRVPLGLGDGDPDSSLCSFFIIPSFFTEDVESDAADCKLLLLQSLFIPLLPHLRD